MPGTRAVAPLIVAVILLVVITMQIPGSSIPAAGPSGSLIPLPPPQIVGVRSLQEVLALRRSVREFTPRPLTTTEIGQLLWAAQGVTDRDGRRTAPSAGGLYPLELYAVTSDGLFHYVPERHALLRAVEADLRAELQAAAYGQAAVGGAPLVIAITGVVARTAVRYGQDRAQRYVQLEAGHVAQNLLLQAVALGLGAVPIGAFDDARVQAVLRLPGGEFPLYLLPIGQPA